MTPTPTCRFGDRCSLATYEDAVDCLASHSEKTRTEIARLAAAAVPGRSEAYLRSCLSPHDDTHNIQLAIAPALYQASRNPALLRWHAEACGFGIYRVPLVGSRRETLLALADVFEAIGDVAGEAKTAEADGRKTRAEAAALTVRIQHAIAQLVELAAAVNLEVDPTA
jgi:hypothetical protein